MGILELLLSRGLPAVKKIKIIRHKDKRCDLEGVTRGEFEAGYQAYQTRDVFNCEYIISCIGTSACTARFLGVYQVMGSCPAVEVPPPKDFPYADIYFPNDEAIKARLWYDLKKIAGFEDLEEKLTISWGPATLSWAQWISPSKDKDIVEAKIFKETV